MRSLIIRQQLEPGDPESHARTTDDRLTSTLGEVLVAGLCGCPGPVLLRSVQDALLVDLINNIQIC